MDSKKYCDCGKKAIHKTTYKKLNYYYCSICWDELDASDLNNIIRANL